MWQTRELDWLFFTLGIILFDRPQGGERCILVQLALPTAVDSDKAFAEFTELAHAATGVVVATVQGTRQKPDAKYYIGQGKALEIADMVKEHLADVVLVNHDLSPSQERNLERLFECRVVSRSGLILDIFAQRARTFEGKLQVELAQLQHLSTRLIRGWTHLERQKGGIGLRGPGETQLETDRRLLRNRIKSINNKLEKVRQSRDQNRRARQKAALPTVSLVGYTNAGKSTLFNALTGDTIYVANQLFATLDPTMRKINLPHSQPVILADTVGFIRDLPHQLVEAFRATLEETEQADLLLHVIDISDPSWRDTVHAVQEVLSEIGATDIPRIQVFNKIDQNEGWEAKIDNQEAHCKVWISAEKHIGLDLLNDAIADKLYGQVIRETIQLMQNEAPLRAKLYRANAVIAEEIDDDGSWKLTIQLTPEQKNKIFQLNPNDD